MRNLIKLFTLLLTVMFAYTVIPVISWENNVFAANPNSFNRLLKKNRVKNPAPPKDGIHDAGVEGVHMLQTPAAAFKKLSKSKAGNYVDWVKSLKRKKINPRFDKDDPKIKPIIMDLDIIREVKGSMPDVVYPHEQHTQWLDCSNCHPAIFIPQKGANQISMASILLGKQCGVCHGKVAFPVTANTCKTCHSKAKKKKRAKKVSASKNSKVGKK